MASIYEHSSRQKHISRYRREVKKIVVMATTSKDPMSASIQFPGQPVYVRPSEDILSPSHQQHIQDWIRDFEKTRPVFIFPSVPVRRFGILIIILSLFSVLLQVGSATARFAFAPSLLGNGIWIAVFCAAAGIFGIASADRLSINLLYWFKELSTFAAVFSFGLVLLYSSGVDEYTKQCFKAMPPTRENVKPEMNSTDLSTTANAHLNWAGECDQPSVVLMSLALLIHAIILVIAIFASVYVTKVLHSSDFSSSRSPPVVLYHSDTMEMKSTAPLQGTSAGAVRVLPETAPVVGVEKMLERIQGEESSTLTTTAPAH